MVNRDAGAVPDITWAYWSLVMDTMQQFPGLFGLDERRGKYHKKLCKHYGIMEETSRKVTTRMNEFPDAISFHLALKKEGN